MSTDQFEFDQAVDWLREAEKIAVFTGAGMSAASGIATFRDDHGFWKRYPPEEFANWKGLIQVAILQPKRLANFLVDVLQPIASATPNLAHRAIQELESLASVEVITQNIDRLHQETGSSIVHEIHGSLFDIVKFPDNERVTTLSRSDLLKIVERLEESQQSLWAGPHVMNAIAPILGGSVSGFHRPDLVLFGDQLAEPAWTAANAAAQNCDVFIAIGTSQSVFPAASLPVIAKDHGAKVIVVDPVAGGGDLWFANQAEDLLPRLLAKLQVKGKQDDD